MTESIYQALTEFPLQLLPEIILGLAACVLFLGSTWRLRRHVLGLLALLALAMAGLALGLLVRSSPLLAAARGGVAELPIGIEANLYAAPVLFTPLALFFKVVALVTGAILVLLGWDEGGDEHAGEYHACLLLLTAGLCLTASANDLITLFLALELVSIPTYVLMYLPRVDEAAQEAALKYFLLSIFASGLLLFGFSYLYGLAGTTNLSAMLDALSSGQDPAARRLPWLGVSLLAMVMVMAGLGFRITAVPFHFYAPDVYQGTTTPTAALLAWVPKVAGFAALLRILGYDPALWAAEAWPPRGLGEQVPMLLWIMAAVTMTLGNILALLQDNLRRLMAYSGVAHAGYMLIGLAVVPYLTGAPGEAVGGVEALLFYLVAYGAMTVGFFAIVHYLSSPERPVETVDDLAGLGRTHPGAALLLVLFLFSLVGMPLTAGFAGKFLLIFNALGLPPFPEQPSREVGNWFLGFLSWLSRVDRLYVLLALITVLNAAIGAWYYLRMAAVMFLREAIDPLPRVRPAPLLGSIGVCAALTLVFGLYPPALLDPIRRLAPQREAPRAEAAAQPPARAIVPRGG